MHRRYAFHSTPFPELLDTPGDAAGGGGATPPAAAGATPPAAATPPATTTPAGTPPVAAAPPATPTGYNYKEDRTDWIPRHRFNETSTKVATLEAQVKEANARIQALAGITPTDPATAKTEEVKTAFLQVFPHLKPFLELSPEQINRLVQAPSQLDRTTDAEQRAWKRHADTLMTGAFTDVADAMGVDALDKDQQKDLRDNFGGWLRATISAELRASNGDESATLRRYEDGDKALIKEFTTAYTKRWVEPARRQSTATNLSRTRPTPNSGARSQVSSIQRPAKFATLDERLDYAANLAKERGVQFGAH